MVYGTVWYGMVWYACHFELLKTEGLAVLNTVLGNAGALILAIQSAPVASSNRSQRFDSSKPQITPAVSQSSGVQARCQKLPPAPLRHLTPRHLTPSPRRLCRARVI